MTAKLQVKRDDLLGKLKAIADSDDELTEGQRNESMELRAQLDDLKKDIEHHNYIAQLEAQQSASKQEGDWQRATNDDYSITNVIRHQLGKKVDIGREREVSEELQRQNPDRNYHGMAVPMSALEQRAVTTTSSNVGYTQTGNLLQLDYRPQDMIPLLRDALVTRQLGATVLRGLTGTVRIPISSAGMVASWEGESDTFTTDDLEFGTPVQLSPKILGVIGEYSKLLMLQSTPDIEMLFRQDLADSIARSIDEAALMGSTTDAPKGITGIARTTSHTSPSSTTFMSAGTYLDQTGTTTNGKTPVFADWIKLLQQLDGANIPMTNRAFLINTATKYRAMQQVVFANTDSRTLYYNGMLLNTPTVVSNIIRSDNAKGTGTGLSTAVYGAWSDLIIGYWQDLDLLVNPYESASYKKGHVLIRAMVICDATARRQGSFAFYNDVKTAA